MYHDAVEVPEETEAELNNVAQEVAKRIYLHPSKTTDFEFLNHTYKAKYMSIITNDFKKVMYVVMDDLTEQVRTRGQIEVNNGLTEMENIRAAICAMLRHHTGLVEVGEIQEEE